jgi:hypothetical protein
MTISIACWKEFLTVGALHPSEHVRVIAMWSLRTSRLNSALSLFFWEEWVMVNTLLDVSIAS